MSICRLLSAPGFIGVICIASVQVFLTSFLTYGPLDTVVLCMRHFKGIIFEWISGGKQSPNNTTKPKAQTRIDDRGLFIESCQTTTLCSARRASKN